MFYFTCVLFSEPKVCANPGAKSEENLVDKENRAILQLSLSSLNPLLSDICQLQVKLFDLIEITFNRNKKDLRTFIYCVFSQNFETLFEMFSNSSFSEKSFYKKIGINYLVKRKIKKNK